MIEEEQKSMDLINEFLSNKDIPKHRIKSLSLQWETVGGACFPMLTSEFYNEKPKGNRILKWMKNFTKC